MFPFRPSRAATALLELAEAMLAPDAFERPIDEVDEAGAGATDREPRTVARTHQRARAVERHRRPAPSQRDHACVAPLTRTARAREALHG